MKLLIGVLSVTLLLAGCAQASPPEPTQDSTLESSQVAPTQPQPEPSVTLPPGYPYIVEITAIPEQMRRVFEMSGNTQAVAIADGVWAELPPGATIEDAVNAGVYHGYCASKETFAREYGNGETAAGLCW